MQADGRDVSLVAHIYGYCSEIDEANAEYGLSYEKFAASSVYKNSVCLCLMQIGELAARLSDGFKEKHPEIPWREIRGMRNIVAHEYGSIDIDTVWETVQNDMDMLKDFCKGILEK